MKRPGLMLALLLISNAAHGQGQFVFNNRIGTEVNARFVLPTDALGTSSVGSPDWLVELLGGPAGNPLTEVVALSPQHTSFRGPPGSTLAGYVVGVTPVVPGVAPGSNAIVLVRVLGPGGLQCDVGPYIVTLGGGTIIPPNLQLGNSTLPPGGICIPEPSPIVLVLTAMAGLLTTRATQRWLLA